MAGKRISAFSRAVQEAQNNQPESGLKEAETTYAAGPEQPEVAQLPVTPITPKEPTKGKGGRPKGTPKKKATYYLPDTIDGDLDTIQRLLFRQTDILVKEKGAIIDQAVQIMRFGLEDPESRKAFLEIYERWLGTQP
ncbi:MAG: hypothetical protein WCS37_10900 [Chloroflexota bacterium]